MALISIAPLDGCYAVVFGSCGLTTTLATVCIMLRAVQRRSSCFVVEIRLPITLEIILTIDQEHAGMLLPLRLPSCM